MAKIFDYEKHWKKVLPATKHPMAKKVLEKQLKSYCEENGLEYDKNNGPWSYSDFAFTTPPKKDTYQWYQLFKGCHWMAEWNACIGSILFPERQWFILFGEKHSNAVGYDEFHDYDGEDLIMDILLFKNNTCRSYISPEDTLDNHVEAIMYSI